MRNWLLPEYIEDVLPPQAKLIESIRRQLLDLMHSHGYQFVIPPMIEYLESLLTGSGNEMELRLFKMIDALSDRLIGIRADITPQIARIDSHLLGQEGVTRLCYSGSVVHAKPKGLMQTREPIQIGAELFGHKGIESDLEIQELMVKCLHRVGVSQINLDLGHVGIFRSLIEHAKLNKSQEQLLSNAIQCKDVPELHHIFKKLTISEQHRKAFLLLTELYGDINVLDRAEKELPHYVEIKQALFELRQIAKSKYLNEASQIHFDLAELRGYNYHTGVVFSAYNIGSSNPIALGGRYDEIGEDYGRARPATGFSLDLRELIKLLTISKIEGAILAPYSPNDALLQEEIDRLRISGQIVIIDLPSDNHTHLISKQQRFAEMKIDRELIKNQDNQWVIIHQE